MKKLTNIILITLLIIFSMNKAFSQSTEIKLDQVELMKQFLGTWKGDFGNNTSFKCENKQFAGGFVSNSQVTTDGEIVDSIAQVYGYDSKINKFIIAELKKSSQGIELCLIWFTSEKTGEIVITNPENAPLKFKFEFKSSDTLEQVAIKDKKVVNRIILKRVEEKMKSGYIAVDGGKIYYEEKGQGDAIVLLHPGLTDLRMWNKQVSNLSENYRVICYDQRGYGKSDIPTKKYSTNKDLLTLLDSLGIEKANLVGICMGGLHALEFVNEYPDRVEKVILSGTAFLTWKYPEYVINKNIEFSNIVQEGAEKAIKTIKTDPFWKQSYPSDNYPEAKKLFLDYLDENKKAFSVNWQLKEQDLATINKVSEINKPVLIIRPEFEMGYVVEIADYLLKNIKASKSVEIESAGHFTNIERPEKFNEIILEFINDK